jgi:hypothetical protein
MVKRFLRLGGRGGTTRFMAGNERSRVLRHIERISKDIRITESGVVEHPWKPAKPGSTGVFTV